MKTEEFYRRLSGLSLEEKKPLIKEFLENLSNKDQKKYIEFYHKTTPLLEEAEKVVDVERELKGKGKVPFGQQFSLAYQMACVAVGEKIKNPRDKLKKSKKRNLEDTSQEDSKKGKISIEKMLRSSDNPEQTIQEYFSELPEEEQQWYKDFHGKSKKALNRFKRVMKARNYLEIQENIVFGGISYSTRHKIACYAAGEAIKTPDKEIHGNGRSKRIYQSQISRLGKIAMPRKGSGQRRIKRKSIS